MVGVSGVESGSGVVSFFDIPLIALLIPSNLALSATNCLCANPLIALFICVSCNSWKLDSSPAVSTCVYRSSEDKPRYCSFDFATFSAASWWIFARVSSRKPSGQRSERRSEMMCLSTCFWRMDILLMSWRGRSRAAMTPIREACRLRKSSRKSVCALDSFGTSTSENLWKEARCGVSWRKVKLESCLSQSLNASERSAVWVSEGRLRNRINASHIPNSAVRTPLTLRATPRHA